MIARSGVPADSHTGKELLDVLETYPRDELLQVGADELLPVALAVLHLQERRQTRLFLRQDPTGRFWSALVYLPRDRYTTEVRLAMQQLLLERLGGTSVEYTARSTESVLARLHFVVRVPVGTRGRAEADGRRRRGAAGRARRGRPQLDRRPRRRAARPVRRRGRAAAGPGRRRLPGRRTRTTSPPSRPSTTSPGSTGSAEGQLSLRLWTPKGAAPGDRRLTIYRVGQRLLLSEVLPVLQNMGVDVVDERPYEIDRIGAPPDLDLRLRRRRPAGRAAAAALAARAVHRGASAAVWRGEAEDDGLGALVMLAGLNWRQVTRRARLRAVAAPGRAARSGSATSSRRWPPTRTSSPGWSRCSRPASPPSAAAAARGGRTTWSSRCARSIGEVESLDADRVLTSLLAAVTATQRTTYYAGGRRWRSSSTRPPCPTCPSRGRPARCGSARRASWASTCASAPSPAAGCAGPTAARTCAPRCSAWSRRRW